MNRQVLNRRSNFDIYTSSFSCSVLLGLMTFNPVFAQGMTESDAAAGEEAQSTREPTDLVSTIQSLLN
jgi:hypothetical protein